MKVFRTTPEENDARNLNAGFSSVPMWFNYSSAKKSFV